MINLCWFKFSHHPRGFEHISENYFQQLSKNSYWDNRIIKVLTYE